MTMLLAHFAMTCMLHWHLACVWTCMYTHLLCM